MKDGKPSALALLLAPKKGGSDDDDATVGDDADDGDEDGALHDAASAALDAIKSDDVDAFVEALRTFCDVAKG